MSDYLRAVRPLGDSDPWTPLDRKDSSRGAVETSSGTLSFQAIIPVAGIDMLWRSSERSIRDSVQNSLSIARNRGHPSVALPLIGAGSGGKQAEVQSIIEDELT